MASYKVKFNTSYQEETLDLEEWGYEDKEWDDLTEEEQDEVKDMLREQNFIEVEIKYRIDEY